MYYRALHTVQNQNIVTGITKFYISANRHFCRSLHRQADARSHSLLRRYEVSNLQIAVHVRTFIGTTGKVRSVLSFGSHLKRQSDGRFIQTRLFASKNRPFEISRSISRDALVFSHKNDNFYKILSYFGLFQMLIWSYLSFFAMRDLKKVPVAITDTSDLQWWKRLLYKEGQYKNALSVLCFCIGGIVLFITMTYPRRAVRSLWILKGGKDVQFTTYSWLGRTQTFKAPVEHIDCMQSRTGTGHHIPLKVKGKTFFFLVDKQGTFHNTDLFDFVIAVKRNIK